MGDFGESLPLPILGVRRQVKKCPTVGPGRMVWGEVNSTRRPRQDGSV